MLDAPAVYTKDARGGWIVDVRPMIRVLVLYFLMFHLFLTFHPAQTNRSGSCEQVQCPEARDYVTNQINYDDRSSKIHF